MLISYRERGRQGTGAGHRRSGSQTSALSKEDEEKEGCKPDSKGNKTQGWEEKAFQNSTIGPQARMNLKGEGGGGHTRKMGTRAGKEIKPQIILISATIHWGLPATTAASLTPARFLARWEAGTASTTLEEAPKVWRN